MSISSYRSQVDRLTSEIADLHRKAADERTKAAKERGDGLRKSESLSRTTSESTLRSRLREIQRHEEKAADHERRAADHEKRIADKRRSLNSSEASLERAHGDQRRKDEVVARRQRDEDNKRLRQLELARRAVQRPAFTPRPAVREFGVPAVRVSKVPKDKGEHEFEYDVCLSFAGEQRDYVKMIARGLQEHEIRVFYDEDEQVKLWGKDLAEHLDYIYRKASRYCVIFISQAYADKEWTRHERRSALARAIQEDEEYILPVRFDDTELPGLRPTVSYIDLRQYAPETLVDFILEKVDRQQA